MSGSILHFNDFAYNLTRIIKASGSYPTINSIDFNPHPDKKAIIKGPCDYKGLPIIYLFEGYHVLLVGEYKDNKPVLICSHPQFKKAKFQL